MSKIDAVPVTVAYGDGIGPEIMDATLSILAKAKANITVETIEIGKLQYEHGYASGITPAAWDTVQRNKILLKAPITTPQGKGYKSLNVTLRKSLGLYANIRPVITLKPYVASHCEDFDLVIVRENEEDLYSGMEYRLSPDYHLSLKVITRQGCEKIVRYAFEYAVQNGRKKVTCFSKDNIMKVTDGLFHKVFDEIAAEYPAIQTEHYIVDIGSARLAAKPHIFDVIVTLNLYGDIISDIAAEVSGSVGTGGSANIGRDFAMFEAVHGSAPDIAGQNIANPSGLLNAACMMLVHIGQPVVAATIQNAWRATLEAGIHTGDIYHENLSKQKVGTKEFAEAVCEHLGQTPSKLPVIAYGKAKAITPKSKPAPTVDKRELVGVDVFVEWKNELPNPDLLAGMVTPPHESPVVLQSIVNRGLVVWPSDIPLTGFGDTWRCRFLIHEKASTVTQEDIVALLQHLAKKGLSFTHMFQLFTMDGQACFTQGQGE